MTVDGPRIVALLGKAGSGKDTVGSYIHEFTGAKCIALADPMKRFCKEVLDFSNEQLWGPSENRNAPDRRYPRATVRESWTNPDGTRHEGSEQTVYLTPRYALQRLGTEWGRDCYENIWIDYAIRQSVLLTQHHGYPLVVITDCRFVNEAKRIREAGGEVWRIVRPSADRDTVEKAGVANHASETEQDSDEIKKYVNVTIVNSGTLEWLKNATKSLCENRLGFFTTSRGDL